MAAISRESADDEWDRLIDCIRPGMIIGLLRAFFVVLLKFRLDVSPFGAFPKVPRALTAIVIEATWTRGSGAAAETECAISQPGSMTNFGPYKG